LDTGDATSDATDPEFAGVGDCDSDRGGASVWYSYFNPTETKHLYVTTEGSGYDTLLAVWTKEGAAFDELVACNDDDPAVSPYSNTSALVFEAQAGITYYIEVIHYIQGISGAGIYGGLLDFEVRYPNMEVYIGGDMMGAYEVLSEQSMVESYPVLGGPVVIQNTSTNIVASLLQLRRNDLTKDEWTGITQVMGVQKENISDTYVIPRYDGTDKTRYNSIQFANYDDTFDANVTVKIGSTTYGPYLLGPGESYNLVEPVVGGPVVISSDGADIIASLYELKRPLATGKWWGQSQMMGVPGLQLSDTFIFPRYNGTGDGMSASLIFAVP
jgi:hypothetical protein